MLDCEFWWGKPQQHWPLTPLPSQPNLNLHMYQCIQKEYHWITSWSGPHPYIICIFYWAAIPDCCFMAWYGDCTASYHISSLQYIVNTASYPLLHTFSTTNFHIISINRDFPFSLCSLWRTLLCPPSTAKLCPLWPPYLISLFTHTQTYTQTLSFYYSLCWLLFQFSLSVPWIYGTWNLNPP